MKSKTHGPNTLIAEVTHIDKRGLWLYLIDKEYFLSYKEYPWFKEAKLKDILDFNFSKGYHLYWPKLEIDLDLDSIKHPHKYPLKYK